MRNRKRLLAALAALAALVAPSAHAASAPPARAHASALQALLGSAQLWATIDVCNPRDQRETVGVRGSMPGDGRSGDKMYMRFRLQYLDTTHQRWVDLTSAGSRFVPVGSGTAARQSGRSFQLVPGKTAFVLRGVVQFQWRRGGTIELSTTRPTTARHRSLAGADPPGYSAATCQIG